MNKTKRLVPALLILLIALFCIAASAAPSPARGNYRNYCADGNRMLRINMTDLLHQFPEYSDDGVTWTAATGHNDAFVDVEIIYQTASGYFAIGFVPEGSVSRHFGYFSKDGAAWSKVTEDWMQNITVPADISPYVNYLFVKDPTSGLLIMRQDIYYYGEDIVQVTSDSTLIFLDKDFKPVRTHDFGNSIYGVSSFEGKLYVMTVEVLVFSGWWASEISETVYSSENGTTWVEEPEMDTLPSDPPADGPDFIDTAFLDSGNGYLLFDSYIALSVGDIYGNEYIYVSDDGVYFTRLQEGSISAAFPVNEDTVALIPTVGTFGCGEPILVHRTDVKSTIEESLPSADTRIYITVDGTYVDEEHFPYIKNGYVMMPLRTLSRWLNYSVNIDPETEIITCRGWYYDDGIAKLQLGSHIATVNNRPTTMDVAPEINYGRTYVPLRFMAEAFGSSVSYSPETRTVSLTSSYDAYWEGYEEWNKWKDDNPEAGFFGDIYFNYMRCGDNIIRFTNSYGPSSYWAPSTVEVSENGSLWLPANLPEGCYGVHTIGNIVLAYEELYDWETGESELYTYMSTDGANWTLMDEPLFSSIDGADTYDYSLIPGADGQMLLHISAMRYVEDLENETYYLEYLPESEILYALDSSLNVTKLHDFKQPIVAMVQENGLCYALLVQKNILTEEEMNSDTALDDLTKLYSSTDGKTWTLSAAMTAEELLDKYYFQADDVQGRLDEWGYIGEDLIPNGARAGRSGDFVFLLDKDTNIKVSSDDAARFTKLCNIIDLMRTEGIGYPDNYDTWLLDYLSDIIIPYKDGNLVVFSYYRDPIAYSNDYLHDLISGAVKLDEIQVFLDGKIMQFTMTPFIQNDRTLVPLRDIAEELGFIVAWDEKERRITCEKDGETLILQIGNGTASVNGRETPLDAPPQIVGGKTFIPLRFIAENFGASVDYDSSTKQVFIFSKNNSRSGGEAYASNGKTLVRVVNNGWGERALEYSGDGVNWTDVTPEGMTDIRGVMYTGTGFLVIDYKTLKAAFSKDGKTWSPFSRSWLPQEDLKTLTAGLDRDIFVFPYTVRFQFLPLEDGRIAMIQLLNYINLSEESYNDYDIPWQSYNDRNYKVTILDADLNILEESTVEGTEQPIHISYTKSTFFVETDSRSHYASQDGKTWIAIEAPTSAGSLPENILQLGNGWDYTYTGHSLFGDLVLATDGTNLLVSDDGVYFAKVCPLSSRDFAWHYSLMALGFGDNMIAVFTEYPAAPLILKQETLYKIAATLPARSTRGYVAMHYRIPAEETRYLTMEEAIPVVENGVVMAPLSGILSQISCTYTMTPDKTVFTLRNEQENRKMTFTIGSRAAVVNGFDIELEAAPLIRGDVVYVPIKSLAESMLYDISTYFDARKNTLYLSPDDIIEADFTEAQNAPPQEEEPLFIPLGKIYSRYFSNGKVLLRGVSNNNTWMTTPEFSEDGINWTAIKIAAKDFYYVYAVGGGFLLVDDSYEMEHAYSKDGKNWQPIKAGWLPDAEIYYDYYLGQDSYQFVPINGGYMMRQYLNIWLYTDEAFNKEYEWALEHDPEYAEALKERREQLKEYEARNRQIVYLDENLTVTGSHTFDGYPCDIQVKDGVYMAKVIETLDKDREMEDVITYESTNGSDWTISKKSWDAETASLPANENLKTTEAFVGGKAVQLGSYLLMADKDYNLLLSDDGVYFVKLASLELYAECYEILGAIEQHAFFFNETIAVSLKSNCAPLVYSKADLDALFAESFKGDRVYVTVNGGYVRLDALPKITDGRTFVPMRGIAEALGFTVTWNGETKTAVCTKGTTTVTLKIGSKEALQNGKVVPLDAAAYIEGSRTMVPLRFLAEAFNCQVDYDQPAKTVVIKQ